MGMMKIVTLMGKNYLVFSTCELAWHVQLIKLHSARTVVRAKGEGNKEPLNHTIEFCNQTLLISLRLAAQS